MANDGVSSVTAAEAGRDVAAVDVAADRREATNPKERPRASLLPNIDRGTEAAEAAAAARRWGASGGDSKADDDGVEDKTDVGATVGGERAA